MLNRNIYDNELNIMENIVSHYSIDNLSDSLKQILSEILNFDIKIMFVGHFNGGKSSLINALIERPGFLAEDQVPMTAVATELRQSEVEYAEIIMKDGNIIQSDIGREFYANGVSHIVYHINSDALKLLSEFTIVDTPGFDSGIENHNQALSLYLSYGSFYVLVISIEKGSIDKQTLNFIHEISNYSDKIVILLNKKDKFTDANTDEVRRKVEETLKADGISCKVFCVSKYDENISRRLTDILMEFDIQAAFERQVTKLLRIQIDNIEFTLNSMLMQYEDKDTFNLDRELYKLQNAKQEIEEHCELYKKRIEHDYPKRIEEVKHSVKYELDSHANDVLSAWINGGSSAVEAVVLEIIRPLLMRYVKNFSDSTISEIIKDMSFPDQTFKEEPQKFGELVINIADKTRDIINSDIFSKDKLHFSESFDKKSIYHLGSGILAIATDIIQPWLEVIIILLPDLVNLAKLIFGESDYDKILNTYRTAIVPKIVSRIHEPIATALEASNNRLIEYINMQMDTRLETLKQSMEKTQHMKDETVEQCREYKTTLENDLIEIVKLKESLKIVHC